MKKCTNCGKDHHDDYWHYNGPAWWTLNGYYGIWGFFCPDCYQMVSHDSSGNAKYPEKYNAVCVKQIIQRANKWSQPE